jgi:hypothetical protein
MHPAEEVGRGNSTPATATVVPGHGSYRGLDVELLDPADEAELMFLIEAMHHIVANQLLADDPPVTWQTVQRLTALGYGWRNIMHMIAGVVSEDVYNMLKEKRPFDLAGYTQRLDELPGDWPPP